jgi:hypothetical protein
VLERSDKTGSDEYPFLAPLLTVLDMDDAIAAMMGETAETHSERSGERKRGREAESSTLDESEDVNTSKISGDSGNIDGASLEKIVRKRKDVEVGSGKSSGKKSKKHKQDPEMVMREASGIKGIQFFFALKTLLRDAKIEIREGSSNQKHVLCSPEKEDANQTQMYIRELFSEIMNYKLAMLFACRSLKDMYTGTDPQQKVNLASALVLDSLSPGLLMRLSESCERHARRCSSQFKFDSVAEILSNCSKLSSQLQPHVCNRIEHIDRMGPLQCQLALAIFTKLDAVYMELMVLALQYNTTILNPTGYMYYSMLLSEIPSSATTESSPLIDLYNSLVTTGNLLEIYLRLRYLEMDVINMPHLMKQILVHEGVSPCPDEGTMKGADPISSETIRAYYDVVRDRVAQWSSFACPSTEFMNMIISTIEQHSDINSIYEVGAGNGYWANELRKAGIPVTAIDTVPCESQHLRKHQFSMKSNGKQQHHWNEYHGCFRAYTQVDKLNIHSSHNNIPSNSALFLCYPTPQSHMAKESLLKYEGNVLIYVGEWHGDTANHNFEKELFAKWTCLENVLLPQFHQHTATYGSIWKRKDDSIKDIQGLKQAAASDKDEGEKEREKASSDEKWPYRCGFCDKLCFYPDQDGKLTTTNIYRDRIVRQAIACGGKCIHAAMQSSNSQDPNAYGPPVLREAIEASGLRSVDYSTFHFDMLWKKIKLSA